MNRSQFTFYDSFQKTIEHLPSKKAKLQAYETICSYALYGTLPYRPEDLNPSVQAIFSMAKPILDRARSRSKEARERAQLVRQLGDSYTLLAEDIEKEKI